MGRDVKWLIAGGVAGAVGAVAWALLIYYANIQISLLAWGIGIVVGIAIRVAAEDDTGPKTGLGAVVLTLAAVVAGKYGGISMIVDREIAKAGVALESELSTLTYTDEEALKDMVVKEANEATEAGKPMRWPVGKNLENAEALSDYPADIVAKVRGVWAGMSKDKREEHKAAKLQEQKDLERAFYNAVVREARSKVTGSGFVSSFGLFGTVFLGLSLITAYKLGSGTEND